MRIIQLVKGGEWGGVARYILDLSESMRDSGHEVVVVSGAVTSIDCRFLSRGMAIAKAPLKKFGDLRSFSVLSKIVGREKPVVIHAHSFLDALPAIIMRWLSRNRNVAVIVTRHIVKCGSRSLFNRWIYGNIDRVVFVSQLAMDEFLSTNPPVDRGKLSVVHNSVKDVPPSPPSFAESPLKLLFVGRVCPDKGIETLLEAMILLKGENLTLDIVGTGDDGYIRRLACKAEENGIAGSVNWLGFHEDVHPFIERADVCVAPSVCRESFGLSVLESMAHGKPVITTDNGAQPEYMTSGYDGILVSPSDATALADAIKRLLHDPELRRRLGRNASAHFRESLSYPVFAAKMRKMYDEVIGNRAGY